MENHPAYTENVLNLKNPVNKAAKTIPVRCCYASIICISIFYERMLNYNQKEEQRKGFIEKEMSIMLKKLEAFLTEYYGSFHLG